MPVKLIGLDGMGDRTRQELSEYSTLYYGDWMARHERSHLKHIARILKELG